MTWIFQKEKSLGLLKQSTVSSEHATTQVWKHNVSFQAVTPSLLSPVTHLGVPYMGPICEALPLPTPRATSVLSKFLKHNEHSRLSCKLHLSAILSDWWKLVHPRSWVCSVLPGLPVLLLTPEPCNVVQGIVVASSSGYQSTWDCAQEYSFPYWYLKPYWNKQGKRVSQDTADSAYLSWQHLYRHFQYLLLAMS